MAKVFIGVGHGGIDKGASSNGFIERDINLNMALELKRELDRHGVITRISRTTNTENDDLSEEIRECNSFLPNRSDGIAIDVHNNAGGGDGFEVFYSNGSREGLKIAKLLEEEVKNIGQNSRGCKTKLNSYGGDYFGFNREVIVPAVIVEGFFVDNSTDRLIGDTLEEQKRFGQAYAKAILRYFGISYIDNSIQYTNPTPPTTTNTSYTVKINTDALNVRDGAGVGYKINTVVYKGQVYTIVEESNGWGKLKSGAGWISLAYTVKYNISNSTPVQKTLKVGSTIKIKNSASKYATGQTIPNWVKNNKYTVQQITNNKVLIKEIISWVYTSDVEIL